SLHRPIFRRDHVFQGKLPGSTGSWNNRGTTVGAPGVDRLCMTTEGRAHMAAQKPRTGDGPLEVTEEGRSMVMRLPVEGGGRLWKVESHGRSNSASTKQPGCTTLWPRHWDSEQTAPPPGRQLPNEHTARKQRLMRSLCFRRIQDRVRLTGSSGAAADPRRWA